MVITAAKLQGKFRIFGYNTINFRNFLYEYKDIAISGVANEILWRSPTKYLYLAALKLQSSSTKQF